jgi:hypothetical protein
MADGSQRSNKLTLKHIVNLSGGLCSLWAGHRTVKEFGRENTILLFADTLYEHPDLYDFNRKTEDVLGIEITRISEGFTPWELFRREGLIGNDRFPICSTKLKREPLNAWMEERFELDGWQPNFIKPDGTVVLGFDWDEHHRAVDFQNQHPHWRVRAPMTEAPYWDKCKMLKEAELLGFSRPKLYELGFPHNNCGGFCVKAGISHFVHLLKVMPRRFLEIEMEELNCQQILKMRGVSNWQFTVLKDRRGGKIQPMTFRELRRRVEAGEEFSKLDWGGCGCGGATA